MSLLLVLRELAECLDQLVFADCQIPVFVQIPDNELSGKFQSRLQRQCSQLPRQVIGQGRRLRKKVLKRGLLALLILRLGAVARIKVVLKVRPEINLVERILGFGRGLRRSSLHTLHVQILLLSARHLIQHRNRFVNLFQDGVFHHLGIDHLLQLELVERKNAHHLHQARRQDLALCHLQVQFGLQQRHKRDSIPALTHVQCNWVGRTLQSIPLLDDYAVPYRATTVRDSQVEPAPITMTHLGLNLLNPHLPGPLSKSAASTQRESFTQIEAANIHVVAQLVRRAGAEDPPFSNDIGPVRHAQRLAHVVVGDQNPDAARLQVEDDLLQLQTLQSDRSR